MATFPNLKTGAAAQYPLEVSTRFRTQTVEFLDGSKQSFALQKKALRSWAIRLDLLDDTESAAVADFVEQVGGGSFLFTDPVSGEAPIKCVLDQAFELAALDELRARATLVVREVI